MQLRRFTADSTPAALGAVRLALGDDAIILANRKIGDQVEIIATGQMEDAQSLAEISLDGESQQKPAGGNQSYSDAQFLSRERQRLGATGGSTPDSTAIEALSTSINSVEKPLEQLPVAEHQRAYGNSSAERTDVTSSARRDQSLKQELNKTHTDSSGNRTDKEGVVRGAKSLSTSSQRAGKNKRKTAIREGDKDLLQSLSLEFENSMAQRTEELAQIIEAQNVMVNQYFKGLEVNLWGNSSPNRTLHLQQLFALGIGAELAIQLVERSNPEHGIEDALRHSFALLKSTLPIGVDKTFSVPGVTILSGPPGAGKTTALMKIATQHVKENGNDSIVIICADTRRIGAFEELQAYGRLLGVPTVHAHDSSELDSLLDAFTHKKLVLIDHTLPMDIEAVEMPRRLLKPEIADSVRQLLVLSATAQSATVDALIDRHCKGRSMQCVLTHLDANARLGEMFNAIIRHHLPIAYWSDAASVQNPLQKAEASVLIATAVAMSKRLRPTPDDEWLLRLVQPSDKLMSRPVNMKSNKEVSA